MKAFYTWPRGIALRLPYSDDDAILVPFSWPGWCIHLPLRAGRVLVRASLNMKRRIFNGAHLHEVPRAAASRLLMRKLHELLATGAVHDRQLHCSPISQCSTAQPLQTFYGTFAAAESLLRVFLVANIIAMVPK